MRIRRILLTICLLGGAASAFGSTSPTRAWCDRGDKNTFQEFSLELEGKDQVFRSWLHSRPDDTGTWRQTGDRLELSANSGISYVFSIKSASPSRLVLSTKAGGSETYYKTRCASSKDRYRP